MLTSVFYYQYYKPFMIGGKISSQSVAAPRRKPLDLKGDVLARQTALVRSVAPQNEVVDYARGFAGSVTGLKEAAKNVLVNADAIKLAAATEGLDSAIDWAAEDIGAFVGAVNRSKSFGKAQDHSASLSAMADDVGRELTNFSEALSKVGVGYEEDALTFDKGKIVDFTYSDLNRALDGVKEAAVNVYGAVSDFLSRPLSDHMNFRSLNYYFDYKLGGIKRNSFRLVESGMLVDRYV